jgi:hypothetical protein
LAGSLQAKLWRNAGSLTGSLQAGRQVDRLFCSFIGRLVDWHSLLAGSLQAHCRLIDRLFAGGTLAERRLFDRLVDSLVDRQALWQAGSFAGRFFAARWQAGRQADRQARRQAVSVTVSLTGRRAGSFAGRFFARSLQAKRWRNAGSLTGSLQAKRWQNVGSSIIAF